ncbi:MAG: PTS galactitol transporter subunit IIB [Erysipelotrichaceae bacterium]|jgi:PTS system galactitol-specific IIB component|nr:PTS galactitol transporter subunit IIB [Erysipelotrichaceae bacterium]
MKRILLCCGTGVATSTVVNKKLERELNKRGYKGQFTITQCKAVEVPGKSPNFDLCVSTIANSYTCHCPMIVATNLILNRKVDETYDKICEALGFVK